MMISKYIAMLALLVAVVSAQNYRPVVLMHGVSSSAKAMAPVKEWIEAACPGIYVVNMEIGNGFMSSIFMTVEEMVESYAQQVQADPKLANGFNAVGFSQGTLVTRGYIQRHNNPPVFNYISWNGPQRGQFGTPFVNIKWVDHILGTVPYDNWAQETFSPAQYWRDPYKLDLYLEKSLFLADLNNERPVKNPKYNQNIESLNAMVLSYSENDKTIVPKESGWFAFYANNTQSTVVPLRESEFYLQDFIGIRALDESNRLHFFTTDCKHSDHPTASCKPYFDQYTLPWLNATL
ncbi:palmitoyl-protein thioesterase 3 [Heterostelium album PN500]|uniref:palmitoyl-protein hydrolase n=1 Tax=Heterostelium pallidum (strain ATCC 26659 / Pp 5 / PN500) TaxID=670386 RepID=D3BSQ5_HETP5|nr:palmitoyl-protein thioesterase 3 [Heterostelium album PN500]EFA75520.1 palmitoyl-protein thioesterase 3 [Heterostelium album PN500]|eukprot:XP_020427654.1 palmitoyl-protein thioesterase 3 [Heterostelium album PN500]